MKNWKFVKVENKDTPELREKLRDIDEQIKNWEHAKGIDGVEKDNAQKTIDDLKKERSKIQQEITTGNSLPHDYHNRYPSDPIYADMKSSAQLESIKKEPWRVYDIMGVGDSIARERVFEMIEEKYGIEYNDIYEAWLGKSWDKAVQKKSMEEGKKLAQKLGLKFGNKKAGNESIDKQEWSMFKGLKKDAEKEIGNQSAQDKFLDDINGIKAKYKQEGKEINLSRLMYELKRIGWAESDFTKLKWPANIGNAQTSINGEWKDTKSPKEQLIEYAKKSNDPEYLEHVKKMTNPNDINARLQWHKKSGNASSEYEILKQDPSKMHPLYKKAYEEAMKKLSREDEDFKKRFEKEYGVKAKNGLCRARNAIKTKNGMGVSDLEAQIRKNKEFIRQQKMRMNGKSKPEQDDIAEGIREAEEEIDRMEMRIADLKETGNKKVGNKKYHVWTDNGSWDMIVDEKELEGLKRTYKNFHYEEVKEG